MSKRTMNLVILAIIAAGNVAFYVTTGAQYAYDIHLLFGIAMSALLAIPLVSYIYFTYKEWKV